MTTLILFALALLADILTTRRAIKAGAVETNTLYGRNPDMGLLISTHVGALIVGALLVYAGASEIVWGGAGLLALVSAWNMVVWRKQKRGAS